MSNFEKASRHALRFTTPKGAVTTEDLWDLPLTAANGGASLNNIALTINRQLKETETESFVDPAPKTDAVLQLKLDIVKHVISVRQAENEAAKSAKAIKEQKQKLLEILDRKKNAELEGKSVEELEALLETV